MSLLSRMVFCSTSYRGRLYEDYSELPRNVQEALKSVTKGQRHKFEMHGIVPVPVLKALLHLGFFPGEEVPRQGMKILALTECLRQGSYKNKQAAENGSWLYAQIMKEEVIGGKPIVKKSSNLTVSIKYYCKPTNINNTQQAKNRRIV